MKKVLIFAAPAVSYLMAYGITVAEEQVLYRPDMTMQPFILKCIFFVLLGVLLSLLADISLLRQKNMSYISYVLPASSFRCSFGCILSDMIRQELWIIIFWYIFFISAVTPLHSML